MSRPNFRFKQFEVWHDKCAMKVGTDGVLLGAWCPLTMSCRAHVLDIGVGSGLISLMLAQRLSCIQPTISFAIQAIDIDAGAVEQSLLNFAQSPWAGHLASVRMALQEYQSTEKFDVIVSNPPYFQSSLKNPDQARATARHTDSLSYEELIRHAARLLAEHGTLALILPSEAEKEIIALAEEHSLYPTHITYVHSKPGKVAKRILIAFARSANSQLPITNTLYIESATSPRSKEYQELTNDFYL